MEKRRIPTKEEPPRKMKSAMAFYLASASSSAVRSVTLTCRQRLDVGYTSEESQVFYLDSIQTQSENIGRVKLARSHCIERCARNDAREVDGGDDLSLGRALDAAARPFNRSNPHPRRSRHHKLCHPKLRP